MNNVNTSTIVFVPETNTGFGAGHVLRSLKTMEMLQSTFPDTDTRIVLPPEHPGLGLYPDLASRCIESLPSKADLVVLDKPWPTTQEVITLSSLGTVLGVDCGAPGRDLCTFLVDMLPRIPDKTGPANWQSLAFLDLPPYNPRNRIPVQSVLVSFGAEDPRKLGPALANSGVLQRLFPRAKIVYIPGLSLSHKERLLIQSTHPGWQIIHHVPHLETQLQNFDLVITSFGLLCFEALSAGTPVLLDHPSRYHQKLSASLGLPSIPSPQEIRRLHTPQFLEDAAQSVQRFHELLHTEGTQLPRESISALIYMLSHADPRCPGCGSVSTSIVHRSAKRTYIQCQACHTLYQVLAEPMVTQYDESYFMEEYKQQYGRTYLDDFETIKAQGTRRLNQIQKLLSKTGAPTSPTLLDIGCAYGPFLQAAKEQQFLPMGLDVSSEAVEYVTNTLGIPAQRGDINSLSPELNPQGFHVVSLWYVIEHLQDLKDSLNTIYDLLLPGGVLALATPSWRGISGRKNMAAFLDESPMDHVTVWDPKQAKVLLERSGFTVKTIIPASYHPERFPPWVNTLMFRSLGRIWNSLRNLGDTMEIYAVKEPRS